MNRSLASLLLALPVAVSMGCQKPDIDFVKIRVGMTQADIVGRIGSPTRTSIVRPGVEVFEYEAYDRYGALIVNRRSQFVRFVNGRVESFGNLEDLNAAKPAAPAEAKALPTRREEAAAAGAAAFDLRAELEKLERLKKDGLISESEFKELRQRVLDKAKAQ